MPSPHCNIKTLSYRAISLKHLVQLFRKRAKEILLFRHQDAGRLCPILRSSARASSQNLPTTSPSSPPNQQPTLQPTHRPSQHPITTLPLRSHVSTVNYRPVHKLTTRILDHSFRRPLPTSRIPNLALQPPNHTTPANIHKTPNFTHSPHTSSHLLPQEYPNPPRTRLALLTHPQIWLSARNPRHNPPLHRQRQRCRSQTNNLELMAR